MSEEMQLALEHTLKTMRELKEAKAEIERLRAAMSDAEKAYQATPASTLEEQIMNPCIAKNEREWWAAAEIEKLRAALEWINQQRYTRRNTINPENAFEHAISLNEKLIAVMDAARAALAQEKPND
jgi:hypothetical protein